MDAIQAAVEQACIEFQDPSTQARAEQVLLHFRQHHKPALPACRHILEHSASADARFQAALAMKDALLREWAGMSEAEREGIQAWLLHEVVRMAGQPNSGGAQLASLIATLAVAVKRGWIDTPVERRTLLLQELVQLVASCGSGAGGVHAAYVGLRALDAIVAEFSLNSASPLGLSWDYHQRCCRELEDHHLQHIFSTAVGIARQAAQSGAALRGEDAGVTGAAIALMATCLQWEFKRLNMPAQANLHTHHANQRQRGVDGTAPVAPGQPWSQLLLDPNTTQWLMALLHQLRVTYGPITSDTTQGHGMSGPLAYLPPAQRAAVTATALEGRGLLLALCSLSGDVLPKQDTQGSMRHQYLCVVLQGVLPMCWPVQSALAAAAAHGYESSELLDACRCLGALAPIHRAGPLQAAGTQVLSSDPAGASAIPGASAGGLLGVVEALTLGLVQAGGVSASGLPTTDESDDKYWQQECVDILLEAWSALLVSDSMGLRPGTHLPEGTGAAAASVFRGVVDAALADAAKGAHEDVDDAAESAAVAGLEDWMARAASLARHAPVSTLPHLVGVIATTQHSLVTAAGTGGDPDIPSEQLSWLVRLAAHCLADSGSGETPLLPLPLAMAIESGSPGASDAILELCGSLLSLPALVLSPQARPILSPRLMECSVWSLARWCDTYLFSEDDLPGPLQTAYGAQRGLHGEPHHLNHQNGENGHMANGGSANGHMEGGMAVLDMAVQVANACLTAYPGEGELHKQVVCVLLPVLVRRKPLCERLMSLPAWHALAGAAAERAAVLQQGLGQKLHRPLMQSLCLAAAGLPRTTAASHYITQLLNKTVDEIVRLAARPDLPSAASRAPVVVGVCCLLESLRGATRATLSRTQPTLFQLTSQLLQPLLTLQLAFKAHSQAVALVLKLASDVVEAHISYLKPNDADALMRWVLALLHQYATINTWAVQLNASRSQQEAGLAEAARDLRALLRLLGHVTQRDLSTASLMEGAAHTAAAAAAHTAANAHSLQASLDTAQVVLTGLNILLPLISNELLKFPKVPRLYFNLLAYMMEGYPEQVCALAPAQFATLMSTLEFGLSDSTTDAVVLQSALEGLAGLAKFQHHSQAAGQPGLAVHSAGGGRSVTSHFMEVLLRRLLLGDWPQDIVEIAADALQPLLVVEAATYAGLAQQLVEAQLHDGVLGQRIANALSSLLHPEQLGGHRGQPNGGGTAAPIAGRHHKRMFREALCRVVADVRSLICMR